MEYGIEYYNRIKLWLLLLLLLLLLQFGLQRRKAVVRERWREI
jgi:hypothetical protein